MNLTRWIGFYMSELFRQIDFSGLMSWNTQPECRALDELNCRVFNDWRPTSPLFQLMTGITFDVGSPVCRDFCHS